MDEGAIEAPCTPDAAVGDGGERTPVSSTDPVKPEAGDELEEDEGATASRRSRRTAAPDGPVEPEQFKDEDGGDGDEGVTRCVCGSTDENVGLMIQCETCKCWQHCACMGMHTEADCPDVYYCEQCRPENHVDLLHSLGFLPSPKPLKRGASRSSRQAQAKETARELQSAREAIRVMAEDNAARLRDGAERAVPSTRKRAASPPRRLASTSEGRSASKRRSTMNSREIGEGGWEPIPPELLAGVESIPTEDEHDGSPRKRKRSPRDAAEEPAPEPASAELAKRRRTQEERGAAPPTEPEHAERKERAATDAHEELPSKSKHANQYTYRQKEASLRREARRTRDAGSRAGSPNPDPPSKGGSGALPEHLHHLAYLLPPFAGEEVEQRAAPVGANLPAPVALTTTIDAATKIRYPQRRMTLGEMRKRVRNIGEYVTRIQVDAVERTKRMELLRTVHETEAAPTPSDVPLSMQLAEQLTTDLTLFQQKYVLPTGSKLREEEEAAA